MAEPGKKKKKVGYIICVLTALALFFVIAETRGLFETNSAAKLWTILSDCFFIPGVALGGIGALTWIAAKGNFDTIGFAFSWLYRGIAGRGNNRESYYEYKLRKDRDSGGWFSSGFFTGLVCIVLSAVCAVIYTMQ